MLKKIAPDKWKHFFVGIAMGLVLQLGGWWLLPAHMYVANAMALVIILVVSYGFELFSKFTGWGRYDILDAVASIIGGATGMAIFSLFVWLSSGK